MPGAFQVAPRRAIPVAYPSARTAYDVGLSHFPDHAGQAGGHLGWSFEDLIAPAIAVAPIPGAPLIAAGVSTALNSGSGTVDQQRQARVNWTLQQAQRGSTTAAAIIIAAPANVASHEAPMWRAAASQIPSTVLNASDQQYPGGWWPAGLPDFYTDTSGTTHRQIMTEVANAGQLGNVVGSAVSGGVNTIAHSLTNNNGLLIFGALAIGALLLSKRR